jgi:hypothetical protein
VIIFVNHSAYDYQLGTINGIGQTVAAGARSVGPALGGLLWSLSVKIHFLYINYLLSILLFLVMFGISFTLSPSIDQAKVKPQLRKDKEQIYEKGVELTNQHH